MNCTTGPYTPKYLPAMYNLYRHRNEKTSSRCPCVRARVCEKVYLRRRRGTYHLYVARMYITNMSEYATTMAALRDCTYTSIVMSRSWFAFKFALFIINGGYERAQGG